MPPPSQQLSKCEKGFLAAMQKSPHKSLSDIVKVVKTSANCDAKNKPVRFKESSSRSIRPLYPKLDELINMKGGSVFSFAIIDNYIIGITDDKGDLHLARPRLVNDNDQKLIIK
jgi:hypothetical protein